MYLLTVSVSASKGGVVSVSLSTNEEDKSLILPFDAGRGLKY